MKAIVSICCLILFLHSATAQSRAIGNTEFLLRAKAMGGFIIEDRWMRSFSTGGEVRFYDQFSLVADIVHFRFRNEEEVFDQPDPDYYSEYSEYDSRNYLAIELRYYPPFLKFNESFRMYWNLYSKWGGRHVELQDNYPLKEGTRTRINGEFYDFGTSLGLQGGEFWGVDFNIGAAYRNETRDEDIYHEDGSTSFQGSVEQDRWLLNCRMSLFLNLSAVARQK